MTRLLVFDDDPLIRDATARLLSAAGYDVRVAENGNEGIQLLREHGAELVLTDIRMGGMDGLSVVQGLWITAPELPLVVMSGDAAAGTDLLHKAPNQRLIRFLKKPFRKAELLAAVAAALGMEPPPESRPPI